MSKSDSTSDGFASKPNKPHPDFPLFPHATKRWAKKIRGNMCYFGPWADPDGALKKYLEQKDALHSGRRLREVSTGVTVKALCNAFLNHKKSLLDAGELASRTWMSCEQTAKLIVSQFGKGRLVADLGPDDFAELRKTMAKTWGAVRIRNFVQQVRSVFKFGYENEMLPAPMRFGPGFSAPSRKTIRLARAEKGSRMFEAAEIRALLNGATVEGKSGERTVRAGVSLRAMILLGVNCGFGNADCGTLPTVALDLVGGWVNYHRPKTGITRRCPLWPETVAALKDVLAARVEPTDPADAGLFFITVWGGSFHKKIDDSPVSKEMRKLLNALGIGGKRNFYALRHTFETIGGEAKDQVAVDHIMGHARDDMASVYRERISDERLKAVSDFVRKWVYGEKEDVELKTA
ncbi:tyrosine-type recombinase/integrase [Gemmata sp. G18]|uniref:Tyrosine-type recombinase/integrase n=1 Tax=Gemmata palustris TaxID=2822762 RepID=A0ABS5BUZ0_9BACT|nr:tyrosine-type recombinase/integrase [Gemmata palustris]MBP3956713.1 tyrosine-type recombinase/integrase [Gemmata palustris]